MRISDWSSDVCSSDLPVGKPGEGKRGKAEQQCARADRQPSPPQQIVKQMLPGQNRHPSDGVPDRQIRKYLKYQTSCPSRRAFASSRVCGQSAGRSWNSAAVSASQARKREVKGTRVSVRVDLGGRRL